MRMTHPRDAYVARTVEIHAKLVRMQQLADDHFAHDPETIHWGHVGVVASGSEIAQREGPHHTTVNDLLRLKLPEPAILAGQQPRCMILLWFQRNPLPTDRVAQGAVVAVFDA